MVGGGGQGSEALKDTGEAMLENRVKAAFCTWRFIHRVMEQLKNFT